MSVVKGLEIMNINCSAQNKKIQTMSLEKFNSEESQVPEQIVLGTEQYWLKRDFRNRLAVGSSHGRFCHWQSCMIF